MCGKENLRKTRKVGMSVDRHTLMPPPCILGDQRDFLYALKYPPVTSINEDCNKPKSWVQYLWGSGTYVTDGAAEVCFIGPHTLVFVKIARELTELQNVVH